MAETLYNNNPTTVNLHNIATAVFSQPELATVGLTEAQAVAELGKDRVDIYRCANELHASPDDVDSEKFCFSLTLACLLYIMCLCVCAILV